MTKALAQVQRRVSRAKRGTRRQRTAKRAASRLNARVRDRRHDFAHQTARRLVARYGLIAVEALVIRNNCLSKSISDAAWSLFRLVLTRKAEGAGRAVVHVNPANTSRRCSGCGLVAPKTLSDRKHKCGACGADLNRDTNAALNILQDGRRAVTPLISVPAALKGATVHVPASPSFLLLPRPPLRRDPLLGCSAT